MTKKLDQPVTRRTQERRKYENPDTRNTFEQSSIIDFIHHVLLNKNEYFITDLLSIYIYIQLILFIN